jgi:hypothetical protein
MYSITRLVNYGCMRARMYLCMCWNCRLHSHLHAVSEPYRRALTGTVLSQRAGVSLQYMGALAQGGTHSLKTALTFKRYNVNLTPSFFSAAVSMGKQRRGSFSLLAARIHACTGGLEFPKKTWFDSSGARTRVTRKASVPLFDLRLT